MVKSPFCSIFPTYSVKTCQVVCMGTCWSGQIHRHAVLYVEDSFVYILWFYAVYWFVLHSLSFIFFSGFIMAPKLNCERHGFWYRMWTVGKDLRRKSSFPCTIISDQKSFSLKNIWKTLASHPKFNKCLYVAATEERSIANNVHPFMVIIYPSANGYF